MISYSWNPEVNPMTEQRETYKGKEIVVRTVFKKAQLFIDETNVDVSLDEHTGRFSTHYLPYTDYPTVMFLARHLIDSEQDFNSKINGRF
jgi:hypothetical protein